jgi:1-acyl-sn-glycerol-3-phosphate acyltransferase
MDYFKIIPRILWKALFLLNFAVSLIILYPLFYILLSKKEWFPKAFQLKKLWARWIFIIPGIIIKVKYITPADKLPQPAVYCANHASYLDVVAGYIVIPNYFVSMGKKELDKVPLFRSFFKEMNILVDRKSITGSHKAFVRAEQEIDKGHSLFLFPEGGILSNTGQLHNFKNGAFKLAIEKQIPVIPITFLNNWQIFQNGVLTRTYGQPGISRVVVHEPISTLGMTSNDLVSLRTRVHDIIQHELDNYNKKTK